LRLSNLLKGIDKAGPLYLDAQAALQFLHRRGELPHLAEDVFEGFLTRLDFALSQRPPLFVAFFSREQAAVVLEELDLGLRVGRATGDRFAQGVELDRTGRIANNSKA
jgi:hypothetical protein